ncbi:MAG: DJ-1/PfpI family protein [Bdellovibrionales bacterium]|nr:DJ-1/PfpI family protein [Bdellovibrionales bacterium]
MAERKESVVVLTYPGCIFFEIALAIELLAEKYQIVIAAPETTTFVASNGVKVQPDVDYASVELKSCKAILVPGGDPGSIKDNERIDEIVNEANERRLLMAAICAGPFVLAKAGVLKGRTIAHGYQQEQLAFLADYFEAVDLSSNAIEIDDHFVTAKPTAHIDFAVEIASRLGVVEASHSNTIKSYYKGLA